MNEPAVIIRFDGNGRTYRPGETLSGQYRFDGVPADQLKAVEVSVLWYTEGKGDEDLAVHEFWRFSPEEGDAAGPGRAGHFSTTLPNSPLSYEGQIVKLRWCLRVRAFLQHNKEVRGQKQFRLGDVPPARAAVL
jgi:hypothetical protein